MSHEVRTPLNAILGFSEIIASECLGPIGSMRYKEYAGDIHNSGAHLLSLINDLLDVAKIEAGRMEIEPHMIDTKHTIEVALKLVGMRARERNQTLTITVEPDAAVLYADERSLKQIVINLVANSVKFTPEGGHIDVVSSRNRDGDFELLVKDDGPGIAEGEARPDFPALFSQIDNRYDRQEGGTGLGLALVRGLTELHGGRAWIESAERLRGTQVWTWCCPPTAICATACAQDVSGSPFFWPPQRRYKPSTGFDIAVAAGRSSLCLRQISASSARGSPLLGVVLGFGVFVLLQKSGVLAVGSCVFLSPTSRFICAVPANSGPAISGPRFPAGCRSPPQWRGEAIIISSAPIRALRMFNKI